MEKSDTKQKQPAHSAPKVRRALPHPNAVYAVIAVAVLLSLTVFTPANINAAATGLGDITKGQGSDLTGNPTNIPVTNGIVCGDMCGDVNGRLGVYAVLNGNARCISIEEFQNNRYCCSDIECPSGSRCVSGVCG